MQVQMVQDPTLFVVFVLFQNKNALTLPPNAGNLHFILSSLDNEEHHGRLCAMNINNKKHTIFSIYGKSICVISGSEREREGQGRENKVWLCSKRGREESIEKKRRKNLPDTFLRKTQSPSVSHRIIIIWNDTIRERKKKHKSCFHHSRTVDQHTHTHTHSHWVVSIQAVPFFFNPFSTSINARAAPHKNGRTWRYQMLARDFWPL